MKFRIIGLIALLNISVLFAEAPVVENVRFEQRTDGSLIVDISYDVSAVKIIDVFVEVSDDGGITWKLPCTSMIGDLRSSVSPGANKLITWDFYNDNPNVSDNNFMVRVMAEDGLVTGTMTDQEGNLYQTVKIGNQWWMAENLKVTHYRNGNPIPNVTSDMEWGNLSIGAYCASGNDERVADIYGYLYNWYAVNDSRNIAPQGWHVPTDVDWKELEMYLGMSQGDADDTEWRGKEVGNKLKEIGTVHWIKPYGTNESGFSALPSDSRRYQGSFMPSLGISTDFWSVTEQNNNSAWSRYLSYSFTGVGRFNHNKRYGFSVRLVRD